MQIEIYQPKGKRIMPETRFTEFPALSADPRLGFSVRFIFLCMTLKIVIDDSSFLLFLTFYIAERPSPKVIRFFRGGCKVTSHKVWFFGRHF